MGEMALKRVYAAREATRGTVVLPSNTIGRKLYGTIEIQKARPTRFAVEERGSFTDKFRGNPRLIEAGFKYESDASFEDTPYFMDMVLNGGVSPVGIAGGNGSWTYTPDQTSDSLKTCTLIAGDDQVSWQAAFATADQADFTMSLEEPMRVGIMGFCQDWLAAGSGGFTGYPGTLPADRTVETLMGWQCRLFVDATAFGAAAATPGTTPVLGRFISCAFSWKDQNKRKYFGDATAIFQKLGRGRRIVEANVVFEALDFAQWNQWVNYGAPGPNTMALRIQALGGTMGTTVATLSGIVAAGTVASLPVTSLAAAIPGGVGIIVGGVTFSVTNAGAAAAATSIPVQSQVIGQQIASASTCFLVKTMNFDFLGQWDSAAWGNRETNTTFAMKLMAMYDAAQATESKVTVFNAVTVAPT